MKLKVKHTSAHIFQNLNAGIVHVESSTSPLNSILLSKGNNYKDKKSKQTNKKAFLTNSFPPAYRKQNGTNKVIG